MSRIFSFLIVVVCVSTAFFSCMKEVKPEPVLEANFIFTSSKSELASGVNSVKVELGFRPDKEELNITLTPPVETDPILKYKPVKILTIEALSGQTVSDIYFGADHAFVSYRSSGQDTYRGTVDVYSIANAEEIYRKARFSFNDVNINAVCYSSGHLLLACSSGAKPAFIEKIAYDTGTNDDPKMKTLADVDALNLCGIAVTNNTILVLADKGKTGVYVFNSETMKQNSFVERQNPIALVSDPETGKMFVLQTSPASLVELNSSGQITGTPTSLNINNSGQNKGIVVKDRIYVRSDNEMQILKNNRSPYQSLSWQGGSSGTQNSLIAGKNISVMKNWLLMLGNNGTSIHICGLRNRSEADIKEIHTVDNVGTSLSLVVSNDHLAFIAEQGGKLHILQRVTTGFPDIPVYEWVYENDLNELKKIVDDLLPVWGSIEENNLTRYPNLVESEKTTFKTNAKTKIYVSIIDLFGSILENSIGYYTYNGNTPPNDANQLNKIILFPNVMNSMGIGNTVVLCDAAGMPADIDAEKEIGFYFIQYGWDESANNGYGGVNTDNPTMYSHHKLYNQNRQQQIIFKLGDYPEYIFIGFKDKWLDDPDCDRNMRNVVIAISDNTEGKTITKIDTKSIQILEPEK